MIRKLRLRGGDTQEAWTEGVLIVNGEILQTDAVKIYSEERYAELPALLVLRALGAEVSWEGDIVTLRAESTDSLRSDKTLEWQLDLSKPDFDFAWATDTVEPVRRIEGDELILDNEAMYTLSAFLFDCYMDIDYEENTVSIWIPSGIIELSEASLVVNGESIVHGGHAKVDAQNRHAVLPVFAVLRALGAQITQSGSEYTITHQEKQIAVLDASDPQFGYYPAPGNRNPVVRERVDGDLILEESSAWELLSACGADLDVDYKNAVIYIHTSEK